MPVIPPPPVCPNAAVHPGWGVRGVVGMLLGEGWGVLVYLRRQTRNVRSALTADD